MRRALGPKAILEVAAGLVLAALAMGLWRVASAQEVAAPPVLAPPAAPAPQAPALAEIGSQYDDDASLPAHAAAVASYTLRATLDTTAHTLHGEGTIVWKNASRLAQRELYVHLYLNAFKNERTVFQRAPVGGFRGGERLADWGWVEVTRFASRDTGVDLWPGVEGRKTPGDPDDETDVHVPLPREVLPGESITIDVAWDAHLPSITLRTGYLDAFHMVAQWFPKLARLRPEGSWAHFPFQRFSEFYADFGSYDVTVDVPDGFVVGATGHLEEETRAGGRVVRRFTQDDVHDFAFTAWDQYREKTRSAEGVDIRCLYPPGYDRAAEVELDIAAYGLAELGGAYGRYPYKTLTLVHPPEGAGEAGGMEYPTLITTGGAWYMPYSGVLAAENVTIHELGHQWFYGLVATDEHAWPFLDEGVNSYAEDVAMEKRYPGRSVVDLVGLEMGLPGFYRVNAVRVTHNAPVATASGEFMSGGDYGGLVYSRTATILRTLHEVYGGEAVRRALGRYARRYRFGHPGPSELIGAFREVLGERAAEAMSTALFDRGWVDFAVDEFGSDPIAAPRGLFGDPRKPDPAPAADGAAPWQGYALVRRRGTLRLPVDVELTSEDGGVTRVRWEAEESAARIPYAGASRLVAVVVDPDHKVLLDQDLSNNARRADRPVTSTRVLERTLFAAEAALLLGAP